LTGDQHQQAAAQEVAQRDRRRELLLQEIGEPVPETLTEAGAEPALAPPTAVAAIDAFHLFLYSHRGTRAGALPTAERTWQRLTAPVHDSGSAQTPLPILSSAIPAGATDAVGDTPLDLAWAHRDGQHQLGEAALDILNDRGLHVVAAMRGDGPFTVVASTAVHHGVTGLLPTLDSTAATWAQTLAGMVLADRARGNGDWPLLGLTRPDDETVTSVLTWLSEGVAPDRVPRAVLGDATSGAEVVVRLTAHLLGRPVDVIRADGTQVSLGPRSDLTPIVVVESPSGEFLATVPFAHVPSVMAANGGTRIVAPTESNGLPGDAHIFRHLGQFLGDVAGEHTVAPSSVLTENLREALLGDPVAGQGIVAHLGPVENADPPLVPEPFTSDTPVTEFQVGELASRGLSVVDSAGGSFFEALRDAGTHANARLRGLAEQSPADIRAGLAGLLLADVALAGTSWPLLNAGPTDFPQRKAALASWVEQILSPGAAPPPLTAEGLAPAVAALFGVRVVLIRPDRVLRFDPPTVSDTTPTVHFVGSAGGGTWATADSGSRVPSPTTSDFQTASEGEPSGLTSGHGLESGEEWPGSESDHGVSGESDSGQLGDVSDKGSSDEVSDGGPPRPPLLPPQPVPPPSTPLVMDPAFYSAGIPRSELPGMTQLLASLQATTDRLGIQVTAAEWAAVPQNLLGNYQHIVAEAMVVRLGGAEFRIGLALSDPRDLRNPAGSFAGINQARSSDDAEGRADNAAGRYHANQATSGVFQTGAHAQSYSGQGTAFRANLSAAFALGIDPAVVQVVKLGVSVSGEANAISRGMGHIKDAEGGRVFDYRSESRMVALRGMWQFQWRTDPRVPWNQLLTARAHPPADQRLILAVPEHDLHAVPTQVQAVAPPANAPGRREFQENRRRIPETYYASGLSGIAELTDEIAAQLRAAGINAPIGGLLRDELNQKVSNLNVHFHEAVNSAEGYHFTLHDNGRVIADVAIHSERLVGARRVGGSSDVGHLELVRTAIVGNSGSISVGQTSGVKGSLEVNMVPLPWLRLGVSASAGMNWNTSYTNRSSRAGLWVVVSRYTGFTSAYAMRFQHQATISVRTRPDDAAVQTNRVQGEALTRFPEPAALAHSLPVDSAAVHRSVVDRMQTINDRSTIVYSDGLLRNTVRRPDDPQVMPLPAHVSEGRGIGHGLAHFEEGAPGDLLDVLEPELQAAGFLPPDLARPFHLGDDRLPWAPATAVDAWMDNIELLQKMVSVRGLDSYYEDIHRDGMSFTLRARDKKGVVRAARITIKARMGLATDAQGNAAGFERISDEYHAVLLSMGMNTASSSVGGSKEFVTGVRVKGGVEGLPYSDFLRGGVDYQRKVGASDSINYLTNEPILGEYPGALAQFRLHSRFRIQVEYSTDRPAFKARMAAPHSALVHVIPGINNPNHPREDGQPTDRRVLNKAFVYSLDTSGLVRQVRDAQPRFTGPGRVTDEELTNFAGNIQVRAHFREILAGQYTTEHLHETGFLIGRQGAVSISATVGDSTFVGSTPDKFVLGLIDLWLAQTGQSSSSSHGVTFEQFALGLGGDPRNANLGGVAADIGKTSHIGRTESQSIGRTGGIELLDLDFHRVYAFTAPVRFLVTAMQRREGKFTTAGAQHTRNTNRRDRTMVYVLAEPEALALYAQNEVPVDTYQLDDAMGRWFNGELVLPGDTVAGVLTRMAQEGKGTPARLRVWARRLVSEHNDNRLPVNDGPARDAFERQFELNLGRQLSPYSSMTMPEYMTRGGARALGHHAVHTFALDSRRTPFDEVHSAVEQAAPGLLGRNPQVWTGRGDDMGRLPGGVEALQSLLSGGREHAMIKDLMHSEGLSIYFVNPVGWFNADVVAITLRLSLTGQPEVRSFIGESGIENYSHAYINSSKKQEREASYGYTALHVNFTGAQGMSGGPSLAVGGGTSRGVDRGTQGTEEMTVYDWSGSYRVESRFTFDIEVRRLNMVNRPINNLMMRAYRTMAGQSRPVNISRAGTLDLKVPRGLAEARPLQTAAQLPNFTPMPKLPGDAYLTTALLDDAPRIARRLVADALGDVAENSDFYSSVSLPVLFSRSHMTNHMPHILSPEGYVLADDLALPGHSSDRVRLSMRGRLFDVQVIAPIVNATGTGRYGKQQSGTSATSNTALRAWTGSADVGNTQTMGVNDAAHVTDPWGAHKFDASTSAKLQNPRGQASTYTDNYRREQHLKQQGKVFLVRLRGVFELEARRTHHNTFSSPDYRGTFRSDPITGDVYAELFADELAGLQQRIADDLAALRQRIADETAAGRAQADPTQWTPLGPNPVAMNMQDLLSTAGREGVDAFQAGDHVTRAVRDHLAETRRNLPRPQGRLVHRNQVQDTRPVILRIDTAARAHRTHLVVNDWAERLLGDRLAEPARARFFRYRRELPRLMPYRPTAKMVRTWQERTAYVIKLVNATLQPNQAPVALPPEVSVLGLDPVTIGRQVAHELGRDVLVQVRSPGGEVSHRSAPDGRTYRVGTDTRPIDVQTAIGYLSRSSRDEIGEFDIPQADLAVLYRDSWAYGMTFEQAVSEHIRPLRMEREADRRGDDLLAEVGRVEFGRLYTQAASIIHQWTFGRTDAVSATDVEAALRDSDAFMTILEALRLSPLRAVEIARDLGWSRGFTVRPAPPPPGAHSPGDGDGDGP
jgi:hypothetical protein